MGQCVGKMKKKERKEVYIEPQANKSYGESRDEIDCAYRKDKDTVHTDREADGIFLEVFTSQADTEEYTFRNEAANDSRQRPRQNDFEIAVPQSNPNGLSLQEASSLSMEEIIREEKRKKREEKKKAESLLEGTKVAKDIKIVQKILKKFNVFKGINSDVLYSRNMLAEGTKQQSFVMSKFDNVKFNEKFQINKIEHILNPHLFAQYQLKKEFHYNRKCQEVYLYHGTEMKNVENILKHNFDLASVVNGKFGCGISFANNPWYASHYSTRNRRSDEDYVMILTKVLIGNKCPGKKGLKVPREGYDTTTNDDGQVLVKYDDACFYPEFIVYFEDR